MTNEPFQIRALRALGIEALLATNEALELKESLGSGCDAWVSNVKGNLGLVAAEMVSSLQAEAFGPFESGFHFGFGLAATIAASPLDVDARVVGALVAETNAALRHVAE